MAASAIAAENISIDDGPGREQRPARCRVVPSQDRDVVALEYERRDGSAGLIVVPKAMLAPHMGTELRAPPTFREAFTVTEHGSSTRFGPFLREDTANEVAKGRGDWGGDGGVHRDRYLTWRGGAGQLMGLAVGFSEPVVLSDASPADAAVEAVLGKLDKAQREIMERALGRR